jgi:hypothetical protein
MEIKKTELMDKLDALVSGATVTADEIKALVEFLEKSKAPAEEPAAERDDRPVSPPLAPAPEAADDFGHGDDFEVDGQPGLWELVHRAPVDGEDCVLLAGPPPKTRWVRYVDLRPDRGFLRVNQVVREQAEPMPARLPSPTSTALSADCAALDDARQAGDAARLALLADRWLHERDAAHTRLAEIERDDAPSLQALREIGIALRDMDGDSAAARAHVLRFCEGLPSEDIDRWALLALARTLDTGPAREEHAEPVSVAVEAMRWPRAVLARALASGATGDVLDKALDAWGASLIAEARRGLTVPHEVVHRHLAERAYAEDATYLYKVYQAAMRWREELPKPGWSRASDALGVLADLLDRGPKPREPEPHPHRDGNEEPWETIERIAEECNEAERERDEARLEAEAADRRVKAVEQTCRELDEDRNNAILRALNAERERDDLLAVISDAGAKADEIRERYATKKGGTT